MKTIIKTLVFAFFLLCLFLFKPRQDIVFAAIDKSQYIWLFEEDRDFELCVEENKTFTGTYTISKDTVFLLYREHLEYSTNNRNSKRPDSSKILPEKLYINESASNIRSTDGKSFSAEIYKDMRHKLYNGTPYSISELSCQKAQFLAVGPLRED